MNPTAILKCTNEPVGQRLRYVLPLVSAHDVNTCGGKSVGLARLVQQALPVPEGFVITNSAFQDVLDFSDIRRPIDELLCDIDMTRTEELRKIAVEIRQIMLSAVVPADIWQSIQTMRAELIAGALVAVRSSAIGEDSKEGAFAGQLDTILNVQSNESLRAALLDCWASYWSHRSLFYQWSRGIRLHGMAIVIQRMVQSQISGVLFTRNPHARPGEGDFMIAEYCYGGGEKLVSGEINPGRIAIDRYSLACRRLATPQQPPMFTVDLGDHQVSALANAGIQLEESFGCPQDLEWTIDDNEQLYLLQSRPITTLQMKRSESVETTVLWSNANVNENYPDAVSPLLYSIAASAYYHYFRNLGLAIGMSQRRIQTMEHALRNIIGVHGARMYYNLSSIHACLRMAPYGESLVRSFNQFVGTTEVAPGTEKTWKSYCRNRGTEVLELCRMAVKSIWQFARISEGVKRFERIVDQFASQTRPEELENRSRQELLDNLRSFLYIRCYCWTSASLADAAAMLSYGALKRFLGKQFSGQDLSGLHHSLLKGLREIVSSAPISDLWELSRMVRGNSAFVKLFTNRSAETVLREIRSNPDLNVIQEKLDSFLENWGYRCSGELMLTVPSYQENPASLIELLQAYVAIDDESPVDRLRVQEQEREQETTRVLQQISRRTRLLSLPRLDKALLLRTLLKCAHTSIALRERARLKQALLYSRCRRIALAIGNLLLGQNQLECASDVFYLTHSELESLLAGSAMFPNQVQELVESRKRSHAELRAMQLPDAFELPAGNYFSIGQLQVRPSQRSVAAGRVEIAGVGASSGNVTARAAILKDISECRLLSKGDILVARQTDPGWGPLFFLIDGLVLERGGMLSHGAILAREYGIPTVVGIEDATRRISHGQTITVNGDRGVVQFAD